MRADQNLAVTDIVSSVDQQRLIRALAAGSGREGFTVEDAAALVNWVAQARITNTLIRLALDGDVSIRREGDEFAFALRDAGAELLVDELA
jgi:hypothetical protein